jgi:hypothetical protein
MTLTTPIVLDVPEIVVEDIPSTPSTLPSRDITSASRQSAGLSWTEPETPTPRDQFDLSDLTPIGGGSPSTRASRGLHRDRRLSDMSALSADLGLRYTYVPFAPGPVRVEPLLTLLTLCADVTSPCSAIRLRSLLMMIVTCLPRCKVRRGEVSLAQALPKQR